jgi:signal transduction histidine kinase
LASLRKTYLIFLKGFGSYPVSGLGLAIVKAIAEVNQAQIKVESTTEMIQILALFSLPKFYFKLLYPIGHIALFPTTWGAGGLTMVGRSL